jgi:hypothetical protein
VGADTQLNLQVERLQIPDHGESPASAYSLYSRLAEREKERECNYQELTQKVQLHFKEAAAAPEYPAPILHTAGVECCKCG